MLELWLRASTVAVSSGSIKLSQTPEISEDSRHQRLAAGGGGGNEPYAEETPQGSGLKQPVASIRDFGHVDFCPLLKTKHWLIKKICVSAKS
ncbi:hypothetical protein PoB_007033500 [Plakobranchus ocellatus]|uniref:Uncharacterized protein n=1 Tax=Plakobranchus ocellatus TaxID=259542 RepID=A0AAV4DIJ6_9GAST|nr:hypothetical protein PoB_007033500 [Plakobranchus ocellatus]